MSRLLLVGHGVTAGTTAALFGDSSGLVRPVRPLAERVSVWCRGPEPACRQTVIGLGCSEAEVVPGLADCDFGAWRLRSLAAVAAVDPDGMRQWTQDPTARPHGGETLAELIGRVETVLVSRTWAAGKTVAVVTPLVARAVVVAALGAPPATIFRVEVGPLGGAMLSGAGRAWRLRELRRSVSRSD